MHDCRYKDHDTLYGKPAWKIRKDDKAREKKIREHMPLECVWECEVKREMAANSRMSTFMERYPIKVTHFVSWNVGKCFLEAFEHPRRIFWWKNGGSTDVQTS